MQAVQREKGSVRLRMTLAEDAREAAALLDEGKADFAVVRSDVALSNEGLTALLLRRNYAVVVVRPERGVKRIPDLRGRTVGVVAAAPENVRLLRSILAYYELPADAVTIRPLAADEQAAALRDDQVDAIFAVGSSISRPFADSIAALGRAAGPGGIAFLRIREAQALALLDRTIEAVEIVPGAFGGDPPRPSETVPTIAVTYRLMAHRNLPDAAVGDVTRMILTAKQTLISELTFAQGIEAPSTDKDAALATHPGAAAYLDGEQETFFEKYGDWFYLGVMAVSLLGSAAAALIGRTRQQERAGAMADLPRMIELLSEARASQRAPDLDALEREADGILARTLAHVAQGELDEGGLAAYRLAFDQTSHAIARRRDALRMAIERAG